MNQRSMFEAPAPKAAEPAVTAVAPWFGGNRTLAPHVGKQLAGCKWVGVPFGGGMPELRHIGARTIVVSDLHRDVINLCLVIKSEPLRKQLIEQASAAPFHPDVLSSAQRTCLAGPVAKIPDVARAVNYFVCVWMGRSAQAGTDAEFKGGLPIRWNAGGGDSNTRFRSAIASLDAFGETFAKCNFDVCDVFDFLPKVHDEPEIGVYLDPPFPDAGAKYSHAFSELQQRSMATILAGFTKARIVCRFYDHPLVREIYPEPRWHWLRLDGGRKQSNAEAPEVLLLNGPPLV